MKSRAKNCDILESLTVLKTITQSEDVVYMNIWNIYFVNIKIVMETKLKKAKTEPRELLHFSLFHTCSTCKCGY